MIATAEQSGAVLDAASAGRCILASVNNTSSQTLNGVVRRFAEAGADGIVQVSPGAGEDLSGGVVGAGAGNLALKYLATGGVYVGGGIAPQIPPRLRDGRFMRSFAAKGRLTAPLEHIPVHVILNDKAALFDAAHCVRGRAAGAAGMTESRRSPADESS